MVCLCLLFLHKRVCLSVRTNRGQLSWQKVIECFPGANLFRRVLDKSTRDCWMNKFLLSKNFLIKYLILTLLVHTSCYVIRYVSLNMLSTPNWWYKKK